MPLRKITLRKSAVLPALLSVALLTGCGKDRPRLALPPIERTATVAAPAIPSGNSDVEVATLIADYDAALALANSRLEWLGIWISTAGK